MTETCPIFFMDGDEILDVRFMEFTGTDDGVWKPHNLDLTVQGGANRMVVELPIGCFEADLIRTYPEDTLEIQFRERPGYGATPWRECNRASRIPVNEPAEL